MADEDGDARKRRLAALKEAAAGRKRPAPSGDGDGEGDGSNEGPKVKFRNYQPYDASLAPPPPPLAQSEGDRGPEQPQRREGAKEEEAKSAIQKELDELKGSGAVANVVVVPQKPNWDLHSQVEGRLDRLKRRTQRAIVEILREKLQQQQEQETA